MNQRRVLLYPHPNLRKRAVPVSSFTPELQVLANDMFETMYSANGIGLSAPQVNVSKRVIVVDTTPDHSDPLVLVNPKVLESNDYKTFEEGCLSFPGYYEKVKRAHAIVVDACDISGYPISVSASGVKAICIQHECDHLDGKLFIDRLSKFRASRIHKKMLQDSRSKPQ